MKPERFIVILTSGLLLCAGAVAPLASQSAPQQSEEQTAPVVPRRIRVGGQVMRAKFVHQVAPKYPLEAKKNHLEGTVRLDVLVDRDGKVTDVKVLSGDSLLAEAATQAVRKWRYKPTTLNGNPVQVLTEVNVNFNLH